MEELNDFLISLTKHSDVNNEVFNKYLGNANYVDKTNNNYFHLMLREECNMKQKLFAISTLVNNGVDINHKNYFGDNFIQAAIRLNYSVDDIICLLNVGCTLGFDINGINYIKQNLFHTFIRSDRSYDEIETLLFNLIHNEQFDFNAEDDLRNTVSIYIMKRDDIPDLFKKFLIDIIFDEIIDRKKKKNTEEYVKENGVHDNIFSIDEYIRKRK